MTKFRHFDFNYNQFHGMRHYIVYAWLRPRKDKDYKWLYVGQSRNGLDRPFNIRHEKIHSLEAFRRGDKLRVWYMPDAATMDKFEDYLIREHQPSFNIIGTRSRVMAEVIIECDECGHRFAKTRRGMNDCMGECIGGPDCKCVKAFEKEKVMHLEKKPVAITRVWPPEETKPNGVGSLIDFRKEDKTLVRM